MSYNAEHIIGNGSFGVVFQAVVVETGEVRELVVLPMIYSVQTDSSSG